MWTKPLHALFRFFPSRAIPMLFVALMIAFAFWISRRSVYSPDVPMPRQPVITAEAQVWYCSMHPHIRQNSPGKCPICHMDLIVFQPGEATGKRVLQVSDETRALMAVQTVPVERKFVTTDVRMVGKVAYDETRLANITAWVPGRLDRLYVDYTGVSVNQGDHMVYLYSPELLTAQEELRRAATAQKQIAATAPESLRRTATATLEAARDKLRRWGLTDNQVQEAESADRISDHVTIFAPVGGTVIKRDGQEGMYVETGTQIYTIADLSVVWVLLQAYESDLPWVHFGQTVSFTTESLPDETFEGKIAFIDPVLNERTRTVSVRVNVPNRSGHLKPGMFVRGTVKANIATGGRVMDPGLAGKWISPMHPEIVKDGPGTCDICGMPLVPAEELGYVNARNAEKAAPLVIPATAPLITGKRAIVYVDVSTPDQSIFEGREITLGLRANDYYIVENGLSEGELVVTHGNFRIDSSLQLAAKSSMMSVSGSSGSSIETPTAFKLQIGSLYSAYLPLCDALSRDSLHDAHTAVEDLHAALRVIDSEILHGESQAVWLRLRSPIEDGLKSASTTDTLDGIRAQFANISSHLIEAVRTLGVEVNSTIYMAHCPMAFDNRGADWLQATQDIRNPYFGAEMLNCGEIVDTLSTNPASSDGHTHE
ncbi:MAG: hypothetical protein AMXMBFR84_49350 [Candidatus Hydrogenedentota bacterium]